MKMNDGGTLIDENRSELIWLSVPIQCMVLCNDTIIAGAGAYLLIYSRGNSNKFMSQKKLKLLDQGSISKIKIIQEKDVPRLLIVATNTVIVGLLSIDTYNFTIVKCIQYDSWVIDSFSVETGESRFMQQDITKEHFKIDDKSLFSFDGNELITSSKENFIEFERRDLKTSSVIITLTVYGELIVDLGFTLKRDLKVGTIYCASIQNYLGKLLLFIGTWMGHVYTFEIDSASYELKCFYDLTIMVHEGRVFDINILYQKDILYVATTGEDRAIHIWNSADKSLKTFYSVECRVSVISLIFSMGNLKVVTGNENGCICFWDTNGRLLFDYKVNDCKNILSFYYDEINSTLFYSTNSGSIMYLYPTFDTLCIKVESKNMINFAYHNNLLYVVYKDVEEGLVYLSVYDEEIETHSIKLTKLKGTNIQLLVKLDNIVVGDTFGTVFIMDLSGCEISTIECLEKVFCIDIFELCNERYFIIGKLHSFVVYKLNTDKNHKTTYIQEVETESFPTQFDILSQNCDNFENICIVGLKNGSLNVYAFEIQDLCKIKLLQTLIPHGKNNLKYIKLAKFQHIFLFTSGLDGYASVYKLDDSGVFILRHKINFKTFYWLEGIFYDVHSKQYLVYGFYNQDKFVVMNALTRNILYKQKCGGGHRQWKFGLQLDNARCLYNINFLFYKNKNIYNYHTRVKVLDIIPNIHAHFFKNEIRSAAYIHQDEKYVYFACAGDSNDVIINRVNHCKSKIKLIWVIRDHDTQILSLNVSPITKTSSGINFYLTVAGGKKMLFTYLIKLSTKKFRLYDFYCTPYCFIKDVNKEHKLLNKFCFVCSVIKEKRIINLDELKLYNVEVYTNKETASAFISFPISKDIKNLLNTDFDRILYKVNAVDFSDHTYHVYIFNNVQLEKFNFLNSEHNKYNLLETLFKQNNDKISKHHRITNAIVKQKDSGITVFASFSNGLIKNYISSNKHYVVHNDDDYINLYKESDISCVLSFEEISGFENTFVYSNSYGNLYLSSALLCNTNPILLKKLDSCAKVIKHFMTNEEISEFQRQISIVLGLTSGVLVIMEIQIIENSFIEDAVINEDIISNYKDSIENVSVNEYSWNGHHADIMDICVLKFNKFASISQDKFLKLWKFNSNTKSIDNFFSLKLQTPDPNKIICTEIDKLNTFQRNESEYVVLIAGYGFEINKISLYP